MTRTLRTSTIRGSSSRIFRQEEARLRDEDPDLEIRLVILEQDLKREYQAFLQDHNRNHSDSDGRPGRDENEVRDWAREHGPTTFLPPTVPKATLQAGASARLTPDLT